ncbi:MAG: phosphatidylcholine synthase [Pseudoprimorskyibacter sp.]|jgi:phosphatidylcholine synthase|nr:phosphatidylcholine synthase [Pseudoprimorskyibacter sp.]
MTNAPILRALSVHLLTATGAVFALLAILAAADENWPRMYLWLLVAFAVDGIDGPLARHYDVQINAPRFDGQLLDLIIDYLTYVFIPACALYWSGLLPGWTGWGAIIIISFASAMYFADTRMKTEDKSFQGFPGCWNMVILVIFAISPPPMVTLIIVLVLAVAMFLPLRFVHPVRTKRWRNITLPVALIWTVLAIWAALLDLNTPNLLQIALLATSIYLLGAGAVQQIVPSRATA